MRLLVNKDLEILTAPVLLFHKFNVCKHLLVNRDLAILTAPYAPIFFLHRFNSEQLLICLIILSI